MHVVTVERELMLLPHCPQTASAVLRKQNQVLAQVFTYWPCRLSQSCTIFSIWEPYMLQTVAVNGRAGSVRLYLPLDAAATAAAASQSPSWSTWLIETRDTEPVDWIQLKSSASAAEHLTDLATLLLCLPYGKPLMDWKLNGTVWWSVSNGNHLLVTLKLQMIRCFCHLNLIHLQHEVGNWIPAC